MSEFSGGPPEIGLESQVDGSVSPVLITHPTDTHDSLIELLYDHCQSGGDPEEFFFDFYAEEVEKRLAAMLFRAFSLIEDAEKPKLAIDQIKWAFGCSLISGETLDQLRRKHGVTKQAFQQGAKKYRNKLHPRSQTERNKTACRRMKISQAWRARR